MLVAGREHYFTTKQEMFSALGIEEKKCLLLIAKDEFSIDEMAAYFEAASIDVTLPEWLPRRPLICQTIARLDADEREEMFGHQGDAASFWNYFIQVLCKRDARINPTFDENTLYEIFLELAVKTRNKSANVGPLNQRDLQEAFEAVVGKLPVDEASVMLQRLPSLGRVSPESSDRQFIDMYILDGLRGRQVARLVELDDVRRKPVLDQPWTNPLGVLGQQVLMSQFRQGTGGMTNLMRRAAVSRNTTLALDLACSVMRSGQAETDFGGMEIVGASGSEIDFSVSDVSGLTLRDCVIENVVLPTAPPRSTTISASLIGKVSGASSISALGAWISGNDVDSFDAITNVSRIRGAGLSGAHEVFVTIIKKTFFQPGAGRKEEALLRGFASGAYQGLAPKILNMLIRDKILTSFRGEDGTVYAPNRSDAGRMKTILDGLRSSNDPLWAAVGALNKTV